MTELSHADYPLVDSRGHCFARGIGKSQALHILGLVPTTCGDMQEQQASLLSQLDAHMQQQQLKPEQCKEMVLYITHPDDLGNALVLTQKLKARSKLTTIVSRLKNPQWRIALNAMFTLEGVPA